MWIIARESLSVGQIHEGNPMPWEGSEEDICYALTVIEDRVKTLRERHSVH